MDQCTHCTLRGDLEGCLRTPCQQHDSWMVQQIKALAARRKKALVHIRANAQSQLAAMDIIREPDDSPARMTARWVFTEANEALRQTEKH